MKCIAFNYAKAIQFLQCCKYIPPAEKDRYLSLVDFSPGLHTSARAFVKTGTAVSLTEQEQQNCLIIKVYF